MTPEGKWTCPSGATKSAAATRRLARACAPARSSTFKVTPPIGDGGARPETETGRVGQDSTGSERARRRVGQRRPAAYRRPAAALDKGAAGRGESRWAPGCGPGPTQGLLIAPARTVSGRRFGRLLWGQARHIEMSRECCAELGKLASSHSRVGHLHSFSQEGRSPPAHHGWNSSQPGRVF